MNLNQIRIMIGMFDKSYLHTYICEPYAVNTFGKEKKEKEMNSNQLIILLPS